jgi:Mn2+ and Fe2+ transporters of the NRAMP family
MAPGRSSPVSATDRRERQGGHQRSGLEHKPQDAFFYGVLIAASIGGILLNLTPVDPIKALYWSAVINGVAAVPLMRVMMLTASRRKVMDKFTFPWALRLLGGWPRRPWLRRQPSCSGPGHTKFAGPILAQAPDKRDRPFCAHPGVPRFAKRRITPASPRFHTWIRIV